MARGHEGPIRIGILWRGDRNVESPEPRQDRKLNSLFESFSKRGVVVVMIPFIEDALVDIREEMLSCDGVLVWVNPIENGVNRAAVDAVLREVSTLGVFVSAHPDVILKLGTKEVLFHTRELSWGSDTALYRSYADLQKHFPDRLSEHGRLVVKQGRGNGGNGVWKVELTGDIALSSDQIVRVQDARVKDGSSQIMTLVTFMERCEGCQLMSHHYARLRSNELE